MLDEYQKRAVEHMDGPCLVIAGPGSGKTKCIVERVFNLIRCGTPAERILVITFTREAAGEMEMRYLADNGRGGVHFSTFHSLFYHILSERYGSDAITPKDEKEKEAFYDSLGKGVKRLFENERDTLKMWQDHFSYFLVDEYQDINEEQFDILKLLAGQAQNVFAVGDDDQSIYSFRGASPELMLSFREHFPNAIIIKLLNNYRCCRRIVEASKQLISHNKYRYEKDVRAFNDSYGKLRFIRMKDDMTESEFIVSEIKEILADTKDKTIGVLFRNRYQGELIREVLLMAQIPFYSGEKSQDKKSGFVYRDLRAMLRIAYDRTNAEDELRVKKIFGSDAVLHSNIVAKLSPYAGINYLIKGAGYGRYLKRISEGNAIYEQELIRDADQVKQLFSGIRTKEEFFGMEETAAKEKNDPDSRVGLFTFHGSKGLEFDHVFIPDVNEGITPSGRAGEEGMEEERRMFYVALTRAKRSLTLITVDRRNQKKIYPSRFIGEMQSVETEKRQKFSS